MFKTFLTGARATAVVMLILFLVVGLGLGFILFLGFAFDRWGLPGLIGTVVIVIPLLGGILNVVLTDK
jgi:hypothetical protein